MTSERPPGFDARRYGQSGPALILHAAFRLQYSVRSRGCHRPFLGRYVPGRLCDSTAGARSLGFGGGRHDHGEHSGAHPAWSFSGCGQEAEHRHDPPGDASIQPVFHGQRFTIRCACRSHDCGSAATMAPDSNWESRQVLLVGQKGLRPELRPPRGGCRSGSR